VVCRSVGAGISSAFFKTAPAESEGFFVAFPAVDTLAFSVRRAGLLRLIQGGIFFAIFVTAACFNLLRECLGNCRSVGAGISSAFFETPLAESEGFFVAFPAVDPLAFSVRRAGLLRLSQGGIFFAIFATAACFNLLRECLGDSL